MNKERKITFHTNVVANNKSVSMLKESANNNYSNLPPRYLENMAERVQQTRKQRSYNGNAAKRTGNVFRRSVRNNTNLNQEIQREFMQRIYTPDEMGVYASAIDKYGNRQYNRIRRSINASGLTENSKRRLRNALHGKRVSNALTSRSHNRFIHKEWNQAPQYPLPNVETNAPPF